MDKNLKEKKTTLRPTRAELPPSQTLDFSKLVEDYTIYDTTQLDQAEDVYWRDVRPLTLPARYRYGNASEIQGASQYSRELKRNLTADEVSIFFVLQFQTSNRKFTFSCVFHTYIR